MKLVRESLNFERTGNVKSSLGIGREAIIRKFFRDLDYDDDYYKINNNGKIIFRSDLDLQEISKANFIIPDNLIVYGILTLEHSTISQLPNKLTVMKSIYLNDTDIIEIPDDLKIGGHIHINSYQTKLKKFIENSKFKDKLYIW